MSPPPGRSPLSRFTAPPRKKPRSVPLAPGAAADDLSGLVHVVDEAGMAAARKFGQQDTEPGIVAEGAGFVMAGRLARDLARVVDRHAPRGVEALPRAPDPDQPPVPPERNILPAAGFFDGTGCRPQRQPRRGPERDRRPLPGMDSDDPASGVDILGLAADRIANGPGGRERTHLPALPVKGPRRAGHVGRGAHHGVVRADGVGHADPGAVGMIARIDDEIERQAVLLPQRHRRGPGQGQGGSGEGAHRAFPVAGRSGGGAILARGIAGAMAENP